MSRRISIVSALIALLASACGAPQPTQTPGTPQPVDVHGGSFAAYVAVPVDVRLAAPAYTPNLATIANPGVVAALSPAQRAALEKDGFVVVPGDAGQIYMLYQSAKQANIPIFVTTDGLLHSFHVLYDYSLRLAEMDHFITDLRALNGAMLQSAQADYTATSGPVQDAARQNLAFFAVATRLLTPDASIPEAVRDPVEKELALIEAHSGFSSSPIFGYKEDYSQYVPRGHYTRNEDFKRYFRAMMWYGRISFHLAANPDDPAVTPQRETREALLIVRTLYNAQAGGESALDVWARIYEPTAFFVGTADDLTVYDYAAVAQKVYGGLPDPAALADEARLDAFIDAAQQLRPPAIVGGYVTDRANPQVATQGFRFMGQRFIPDSYILQQLVYSQVALYQGSGQPFTLVQSEAGPIRGFPRGLDVPATLGSKRALEILTVEGDTDYDGYGEQLAKVQGEFAALPAEQWTANLYWNWLYTLGPLLAAKGEGYPYFMRSPAWADKDLHTWLSSWTELRHDTILYAKQSYTSKATGMLPPPEVAHGYVEPQPEVYARLAALAAQMRSGLGDRGLLNSEMAGKLAGVEQLLLSLKTISEKELRGEGLAEEEYATIQSIGDTLANLTTFSPAVTGEITSAADTQMALIADVHTDPNSGQVLEEGVGSAFPIYVVVLVDGQQVVTMGGVFSYHEFKWSLSDRLTDEKWQEMSPRPERPAWTGSFVIE